MAKLERKAELKVGWLTCVLPRQPSYELERFLLNLNFSWTAYLPTRAQTWLWRWTWRAAVVWTRSLHERRHSSVPSEDKRLTDGTVSLAFVAPSPHDIMTSHNWQRRDKTNHFIGFETAQNNELLKLAFLSGEPRNNCSLSDFAQLNTVSETPPAQALKQLYYFQFPSVSYSLKD